MGTSVFVPPTPHALWGFRVEPACACVSIRAAVRTASTSLKGSACASRAPVAPKATRSTRARTRASAPQTFVALWASGSMVRSAVARARLVAPRAFCGRQRARPARVSRTHVARSAIVTTRPGSVALARTTIAVPRAMSTTRTCARVFVRGSDVVRRVSFRGPTGLAVARPMRFARPGRAVIPKADDAPARPTPRAEKACSVAASDTARR